MEIISNVALITINETMIAQLVSFLIFLFLLNRIMIRPLNEVIHERDNYIANLRIDIVNAEEEMESITQKLREQEAAVREEAFAAKKEVEEAGAAQANQIFQEIKAEIDALKKETEAEVNAQLAEAQKHLAEESQALAAHIMEKVLDRRLLS